MYANHRTAKVLILSGSVIDIKLNISEHCETFISLVKCVNRIQAGVIVYKNSNRQNYATCKLI